ncbi:AhpC/TSA family protein [Cyanobacterium stanieri LEGE 03274]|uniref:AhpC/TSA family protein n=1 Tax=Cyanobacterium stanieri LEGE 03274 TaxID=1828756 RepID=A0ABR9V561_9CHRO|nr:peroxiredoxin-like family protein [Cyanobacterium stanieri]MBE9222661.1 AhpC/TSA family protein [Cyanobacterium stanieri LEGE 03274]
MTNSATLGQFAPYTLFQETQRQRVSDGEMISVLSGCENANRTLMIVLPQLGDFDTLEYAWWLQRKWDFMENNNIAVRAIAIGNLASGKKFCQYTGFPEECLFIDTTAEIHRQLGLYQGLNWGLPFFSQTQNAWLNLLLMCAGIGSKGTLKEVFRGYKGDRTSPPLFKNEEEIKIKPLPTIKGEFFNKAGKSYQRPFELATLRLKNMVEVLNNWRTYVPDDRYITQRGATFLFDNQGNIIYEHRDQGILGFAENMSNPLDFLSKVR